MLGIVDYETHFMGDWNGTGACTSHHGSQCCYTDAANLVAAHVADQAKAWSFVHCMFSNQKSLCPKTWDDDKEECGTEDREGRSGRFGLGADGVVVLVHGGGALLQHFNLLLCGGRGGKRHGLIQQGQGCFTDGTRVGEGDYMHVFGFTHC